MSQPTFRRPAMLDPEKAEQIPGAEDPLVASQVAHLVAQTVLGWYDLADEQQIRLRELIENGGIEAVNELWADSPADTLPGTLWRVYLVHQWCVRDPETVYARFSKGVKVLRASHCKNRRDVDGAVTNRDEAAQLNPENQEPTPLAPNTAIGTEEATTVGDDSGTCDTDLHLALQNLVKELACLWRGELREDLPTLLEKVADFLITLTYGVNTQWIEDAKDELANEVTRRPQALLQTAQEMRESAQKAAIDQLS